MLNKIKKLTGILLILFCLIVLLIMLLKIWEIINYDIAKEIFIKVLLTFVSVFVISLLVLLITKTKKQ